MEKHALGTAAAEPLFDHLSDGLFIVDRECRIRIFNRAAAHITGVPEREAVGSTCHKIFTGTESGVECVMQKRHPCTVRALLEAKLPLVTSDTTFTFPTGRRRSLKMRAIPLFSDNGVIERVAFIMSDVSEVAELREELGVRHEFENIIGHNHKMREIYKLIDQIAETDATVLIEGESGTGKELVARAIHYRSRRKGAPFVQVNCSALVETLLESELFGHVRGAFTGAVSDKIGRFEAADGGTIFLDEIGDISPSVQVKLLHVIQERRFERVGENESRTTDVRIITATNRHLRQLMETNRFREDLYYRLRVVPIQLPPLRERREDIPLLVNSFIERFRKSMGKPIKSISKAALGRVMDYNWPGNVRELENSIEHAFVRCTGEQIEIEDLPVEVRISQPQPSQQAPAEASTGHRLHPTEDAEREIILAALRSAHGNKSSAAESLGIGRTTLWRRMKELNIPDVK